MTRISFAALVLCACVQVDRPWEPTPSASSGGGTGGGFVTTGGGFTSGTGGSFAQAGGPCGTEVDFAVPDVKAMPPAISGGTLVSLPNGTLVAGDPDRDALWVVENRGALVRRIALRPGDEPGRLITGPDGIVFAVLRRANQVAQLTVASGELSRLETCHLPRSAIWQSATDTLLVACADGTIEQHHAGTRTPMTLSNPLFDLRDLVPDGPDFIATTFRDAKAYRISAQGAVSALATTGIVSDATAQVAWRAVGGATSTRVVLQSERVAPIRLSKATCGAYGQIGTVPDALPGLVVTTLAHTTATGLQVDALVPFAVLPVDLAVNELGVTGLVSAGTNQVVFSSGPVVTVSAQPTSIVAQPGGWAVFEREPAGIAFFSADGALQTELPLPGASVASTGHSLFHTATQANLACASCHPEGGEDGHVWNFDTGSRRTQTLRGGLSQTAPFHWEGDEDTMFSLITDVMAGRMSGHQQTPDRVQAMLNWLDAQPALEAPPTNAEAVARGAVLFASNATGCSTCHFGALGTNNQTLNVGTGGAFQVPRLVELGWRMNWFHDGRVKTPNDRFAPEGGVAHGTVSTLTAQDKADLVEYLRSR
jgi:Cytochrome c